MLKLLARCESRLIRYALLATTIAALVVVTLTVVRLISYANTVASATAVADGEIIGLSGSYHGEPPDQIDVRWTDADGHQQLTVFRVEDPSQWANGQTIQVRYIPGDDPDRTELSDKVNVFAVPGGVHRDDEPSVAENTWPIAPALLVGVLVWVPWLTRWRRNLAAAKETPTSMRMYVVPHDDRPRRYVTVLLAPPDSPLNEDVAKGRLRFLSGPGLYWQRLFHDPAVDGHPAGDLVSVYIGGGRRKRAVVEVGPGVFLWPAGPARDDVGTDDRPLAITAASED